MTAHELARKLLEGPDLMVTVRGYEAGVDEVATICPPQPLALHVFTNDESWYGLHSYYSHDIERKHNPTMVQAIHLTK